MVSSIAASAANAYTQTAAATIANVANNAANTSPIASQAVIASSDTVTLSANAQRLQTAEANLNALQSSGANLYGIWNSDILKFDVGGTATAAADAQVAAIPPSDADHLKQAQQAQAYTKAVFASLAPGGKPVSVPNPFSGMPATALAAIVTDSAGLYTNYEKDCAYRVVNDPAVASLTTASAQGIASGDMTGFYKEAIKQYNSLPPIIQASFGPGYLDAVTKYANGSTDDKTPGAAPTAGSGNDMALKMLQQIESAQQAAMDKQKSAAADTTTAASSDLTPQQTIMSTEDPGNDSSTAQG